MITMSEQRVHDLNFKSGQPSPVIELCPRGMLTLPLGMVTSWNKLCFTTGYIEVSISLPGAPKVPGLWPGKL